MNCYRNLVSEALTDTAFQLISIMEFSRPTVPNPFRGRETSARNPSRWPAMRLANCILTTASYKSYQLVIAVEGELVER